MVQPRCRNPTRRNRTRRAITVGLRSAKDGPNQTIRLLRERVAIVWGHQPTYDSPEQRFDRALPRESVVAVCLRREREAADDKAAQDLLGLSDRSLAAAASLSGSAQSLFSGLLLLYHPSRHAPQVLNIRGLQRIGE